jgi:hypothetical protein
VSTPTKPDLRLYEGPDQPDDSAQESGCSQSLTSGLLTSLLSAFNFPPVPTDLLPSLTQFGVAGLIGLLWILERRNAAAREKQLDESHGRILALHRDAEILLSVIRENTRAIAALEHAQQRLIALLDRSRPRSRTKKTLYPPA